MARRVKSFTGKDGRVDRQKVETDVSAFIDLWIDSLLPDGPEIELREALAAREAIDALARQGRERRAESGRGSGSARRGIEAARKATVLRIDEEIVRRRHPHLTSLNARAEKVRQYWPASAGVDTPGRSTIRRWLKKLP